MPQNQVAFGTCDCTMNPADGVGSLKQGPRTPPAHAEGRLVYDSADWDGQNGNPCAGINRHEAENAKVLRERGSDPLGLEFCVRCREVSGEA